MSVLKEIERHFGKDIAKLDAEVGDGLYFFVSSVYFQDVDEIEKLNQD